MEEESEGAASHRSGRTRIQSHHFDFQKTSNPEGNNEGFQTPVQHLKSDPLGTSGAYRPRFPYSQVGHDGWEIGRSLAVKGALTKGMNARIVPRA